MATVYKTFTKDDANNRRSEPLSVDKKAQVMSKLNSFVTYFKAKHL